MMRGRSAAAFVIALGGVLGAGVSSCTKKDSLILLDLRTSGPLGAPVARVRLSAKGWQTKTLDATIDATGFRVGYYGPGDGKAVSVLAEAIDLADCVLGSGEATIPSLEAGATSAPTTLFVRPRPENGCVTDAGMRDDGSVGDGSVDDGAAEDGSSQDGAAEDGSSQDGAAEDGSSEDDGGRDATVDVATDGGIDGVIDAPIERADDGAADTAPPDAPGDMTPDTAADAGSPDGGAGPDGGTASDDGGSDAVQAKPRRTRRASR